MEIFRDRWVSWQFLESYLIVLGNGGGYVFTTIGRLILDRHCSCTQRKENKKMEGKVQVKHQKNPVNSHPCLVSITSYLSLSQRDGVEFVPTESLIVCILEQSHGRIGARGENKDKRRARVTVHVGLGKVKWRRLHELLAEFFHHEVGDGQHDLETERLIGCFRVLLAALEAD